MKKLIKYLMLAVIAIPCYVHAEVTISASPMTLYKDGVEVEGVTKSTSREKLMEKASSQGNGVYKGYSEITITVTGQGETTEPEVCPSGQEGTPPNCTPIIVPVTCTAPQVNIDNQCVTTIESCQAIGMDRPNGDLSSCMNDPEPVCEAPREWRPAENPNDPDYCGCPTVGDTYHEATNECKPLDMSHNHQGLPHVDLSLQPPAEIGHSDFRIRPTSDTYNQKAAGSNQGEFRTSCPFSHMANNDPLVFPNQEGASHHHTFFGNTSVNHASDVGNLANVGNSTCAGGIANRSGYWIPSMIDTSTGRPLKPIDIGVYYKTVRASDVTAPPKGLRMIAKGYFETRYECDHYWNRDTVNKIGACGQGSKLSYNVNFPNCWDGEHLYKPDQSHMYYAHWDTACPASHPVRIPDITINAHYRVDTPAGTTHWRLASDADDMVPGSSVHADWINGWDETVMQTLVDNCLKAERDCHSFLLGDGTTLY